jgi:hypothetical protein
MGTTQFPIQKRAIFRKVQEINGLRGGVHLYVAQATPQIDAEIAEKGRFWMETIQGLSQRQKTKVLVFGA